MADKIKTKVTFENGIVGFDTRKVPAKTLRAKVGAKPFGGGGGGGGGGGEGGEGDVGGGEGGE